MSIGKGTKQNGVPGLVSLCHLLPRHPAEGVRAKIPAELASVLCVLKTKAGLLRGYEALVVKEGVGTFYLAVSSCITFSTGSMGLHVFLAPALTHVKGGPISHFHS